MRIHNKSQASQCYQMFSKSTLGKCLMLKHSPNSCERLCIPINSYRHLWLIGFDEMESLLYTACVLKLAYVKTQKFCLLMHYESDVFSFINPYDSFCLKHPLFKYHYHFLFSLESCSEAQGVKTQDEAMIELSLGL